MAGWHHQYNEHKLGQTPGNGEGQGNLANSSPWVGRVGRIWVTEQQQEDFNILEPLSEKSHIHSFKHL